VPPWRRPGAPAPAQRPTATREYLQSRLGAADLAIWDARGPLEFGEKVLAAKGGHIPGAVNFEWTAGMDNDHLRIRRTCRRSSNNWASPRQRSDHPLPDPPPLGFTYLVAKSLGYPRVKAYAGSWGEWGNHPDTPVEGLRTLMKKRLFILSQYLLPHHLLSRLAGCIAECRVRWFKNAFTAWFAKRYQVDMSEALVEDLTAYEHFNAFFTRA
jgi:phosphatidylserine decarboxylase